MKINWLLRLQNRATLTSFVMALVALVYQVMGIIGFVPSISQDQAVNIVGIVINLLVMLGIVVDPTTSGISDSNRALEYDTPAPNAKQMVE